MSILRIAAVCVVFLLALPSCACFRGLRSADISRIDDPLVVDFA